MRLNRKWADAEIRSVVAELHHEYPSVPSDVVALVVQVARSGIAPDSEPSELLVVARRLLGQSILMQAIQDPAEPVALAS